MVFFSAGHPSIAADPAPTATAAKVPESIVDVGEYGENIYDAAKAGKWADAEEKLAALKKAADLVPSEVAKMIDDQKKIQSQITADILALQKSVLAKDKQATLEKANEVTFLAANLSAPFNPTIPVNVVHLDYLGRELEVWAAVGDLAKLQQTAKEIEAKWSKVRPAIEAKGAAEVAKKFSEVVARVMASKSAKEYEEAAKPLLDEVDNLEEVFTK
jgi:hypothetical protein